MLIHRVIVGSMFTNAYIVSIGKKECLLIDPGADTQHIIQRLEAMNLIPQMILFTHGHLDHTSSAAEIISHFADRTEQILVGIHEKDAPFIGPEGMARNRELFGHFGEPGISAMESFGTTLPEADFFFKDGEVIPNTDLTVILVAGHSPGSSCFYSETRQALFSGDVLYFNTIGRTDFPEGNSEMLVESVTKKLFELPPETRVFPGHGPLTTIEREVMNNPMESEGSTF